jgi:hypothetical protein
MLYGIGWIIATDTSVGRFAVMTIALLITLALGYVRFVRRGTIASTPGASIEAHDLVDLERRVHDLEERMREAATALGPKTS